MRSENTFKYEYKVIAAACEHKMGKIETLNHF